jgi:O-antigen ligase
VAPLALAAEPPRRRFGPVHFFAIYLLLLFTIPSQLVVPGMGANGTPATVFALMGFGWWTISTLIPGEKEFRQFNPVRLGLAIYLGVVLLSWAVGKMRPLTPLEATTSDRALMAMFGLAGVALVAMDGLRSMDEVARVVDWLIGCAMVMVTVGLIQFFFGYDLARNIRIPGLEYNAQIAEINMRSDFNRPRATAGHPIEFGVVSAALLPLAYWRASCRHSKRALIPIAALFLAAMVSLSRSAVLSFAILGIVMLVGVSWRQRVVMVAATIGGIVVAGTLVSGLVGTIRSLFTGVEHDPSVQARLARWPAVVELVSEHPWLGLGFGTYSPEDYFLLDNEIWQTTIENGLIGLAALVLFIVLVTTVAWRTRGKDELSRLLGTALAATILGIFISTYTFDSFHFKILMGTLYLSIGLVGAIWRITAADRTGTSDPQLATREVEPIASRPRPTVTA